VAGVSENESGPDENPNRLRSSQSTGSVARALRAAIVFLLRALVVVGIKKVFDWLLP
jgi:hypothetical protein